jgi:hypothetical protein
MKTEEKSPEREYEPSGLYPKEGKPFRLVALLLGLSGVVIFLAAAAAILNFVLI